MLRRASIGCNNNAVTCHNSSRGSLPSESSRELKNDGMRDAADPRNVLSRKLRHPRADVNPKTSRLGHRQDRIFLSGDILSKKEKVPVDTENVFISDDKLNNRFGPFFSDKVQRNQNREIFLSLSTCSLQPEPSEEELTISNIFQSKTENLLMAALFCASEEGNLDALKSLTEMTADLDLNTTNKHGETVVHMAASGGHADVIKYLLTKGVDITIKDKQGDSAVYWAARQGHVDVIRCLVEAGVCINTQNKSAETALHVAARYGYTTVVKYLCSVGADINLSDKLGETPLHCAAWHGHMQIVRILCESKAVLTLQNMEMETALHCAAARGNIDCVKVLVEFGAPLNTIDKRGSTALHLACQRHYTAIALFILDKGCQMDVFDKEIGESALHCAAREGLFCVVERMCSLGVSVNVTSTSGFTALHLACKFGHAEIVRCLLLSGANLEILNKDGLTSEIMALAHGFKNIAELVSSCKGEKRLSFISQLKPLPEPISRVKLKLLGSSGMGKSTFVESLKIGFLASFFRRKSGTTSTKQKIQSKPPHQFSVPAPVSYTVRNSAYTRGIDVQTINVIGAGEISVWDFSGYEPYYMLYDYFLGDVSCIHVMFFSLEDSLEDRMAQIIFWLNFLRARIHSKLPLDYCGKLQNTATVILVATHADKPATPCYRSNGGICSHKDNIYILEKVTTMFQYDLDIYPTIFVMNTQKPSSPDMRAFKQQLARVKHDISKKLPHSSGLLTAVVAELAEWRHVMMSYPVLSWSQFTEQVRECVNPLVSDDDLKLLDRQLQLMGEIVHLHGQTDLVVITPQWLGTVVLGALLSHERIMQAKVTGCFSLDEFQLMFPDTDALSLLELLEAMELCTPCEVDGDVEYEFPCLNFVEALEGLWLKDKKLFPNPVYGGIQLHTSFQSGSQLKYLFPRIQVFLRRSILSVDDETEGQSDAEDGKPNEDDPDLYQWHHGSKYCCSCLEGMIDMDKNEQFLEVKVRGPLGERTNLYYFLEDFVSIIEQVVENVCPGLCVERYSLSPSHLKEHDKVVRAYSPTELLRMQLDNRSSVILKGNQKEDFKDIACLGSDEILNAVTLGIDLPISHLSIHTQRLLSLLLDPSETMGKDWCLLAVTVGLSDALLSLEIQKEGHKVSPTQKVLKEWARRCPDASTKQLVQHLKDIGRLDAVEIILRTGSSFKVLSFDGNLLDGRRCVHDVHSSTHTLSNLSR